MEYSIKDKEDIAKMVYGTVKKLVGVFYLVTNDTEIVNIVTGKSILKISDGISEYDKASRYVVNKKGVLVVRMENTGEHKIYSPDGKLLYIKKCDYAWEKMKCKIIDIDDNGVIKKLLSLDCTTSTSGALNKSVLLLNKELNEVETMYERVVSLFLEENGTCKIVEIKDGKRKNTTFKFLK